MRITNCVQPTRQLRGVHRLQQMAAAARLHYRRDRHGRQGAERPAVRLRLRGLAPLCR